jgi:hypothetical protein
VLDRTVRFKAIKTGGAGVSSSSAPPPIRPAEIIAMA